jgi:hypothetical protein
MEENDRDLRDILIILVEACKKHHLRAMTLNTCLTWMIELPPNSRAALTLAQLEAQCAKFQEAAAPIVDKRAPQLEQVLSGDKPFLEALRIYASEQHWMRNQ